MNKKDSKKMIKKQLEVRVPADLSRALNSNKEAKEVWQDITPIARRDWILWVITAKKIETRKRRIEKACNMLQSGKRRVCCFGGLNWVMENTDVKLGKEWARYTGKN